MEQKISYQKVISFDINLVRQAFEEGCLYIAVQQVPEKDTHETGILSILEYVSRIDGCASPDYRLHIRDLWEAILRNQTISPLFFYTRYSHNRGQVNWYRVTAMVCLLREWKVYRSEYSGSDLHCILEGTNRRNGRYTGMNRYLVENRFFGIIRQKMEENKQ